MSATTKSIALITASTRTPRVGPNVTSYIKDILQKDTLATPAGTPVTIDSVDLADFKLPVYDEELIPAQVQSEEEYKYEHTKAWSREIRKHDAYIWVTPEYNWGIPGGAKNAIDYLKNEWTKKPAAVISYGISGGADASANTEKSLRLLGLRVAETRPALDFGGSFNPEVGAAVGGSLSEDSSKRWTAEKKDDILKAFSEVKKLLDEKPE